MDEPMRLGDRGKLLDEPCRDFDEYVQRIVASAPPLTADQRARLAALFGANEAALPPAVPFIVRAPKPSERTALYRHYDDGGVLLYVGITNDPEGRTRSHAKHSSWSEFAVDSKAEWFNDRAEALIAERRAIETEGPLFNGTHAEPDTARRLVAYLVARGRLDLLTPQVSRG